MLKHQIIEKNNHIMKINRNIKVLIIFCLTQLLIPFLMTAQNPVKITGKISDSDGVPVVGASVMQTGTQNGSVTDFDGNYIITLLTGHPASLTVSSIGFKTLEVTTGKKSHINIVLEQETYQMDEVSVVAYGVQKKETITGAISSVGTEQLLKTPTASIANALAGQLSGVSSVSSSGQPGMEDPQIYVRGVGTLTDTSPLVLVDGIEMPFYQMDPNEIDNITVLKDASATAVFGVRGANGVILVTTRRGSEGRAKISLTSTVGLTRPTRLLDMADSYQTALRYNEMALNDGTALENLPFSPYVIDMFKTGKDPIMFPNTDWNEYLYKDAAVQTQHNINISGGTDRIKYFVSLAYLYQDGQVKNLPSLNYDPNFNFQRYNFRTNLDIDVTRSTKLKISIGGISGKRHEPINKEKWTTLMQAQPFSSPGVIDGRVIKNNDWYFGNIHLVSGLEAFYSGGYKDVSNNNLNMNLEFVQKLDFITKGLNIKLKGAYNSRYSFTKARRATTEHWSPSYKSSLDGSGLKPGDEGFDYGIIYRLNGKTSIANYNEQNTKGKDWYLEASLNYDRKFNGKHHVTALLLYNQSKRYYPAQFTAQPSSYVGLVARITYNYKMKYLCEFNAGYNGSENFAPGKTRYGFFPAFSAGWILTQEPWMKKQKVVDYLKIRATCGLVGNDNMSNNRYLYLPDSYILKNGGYNLGVDIPQNAPAAQEGRIGNPNVTWETAIKQNYGIEATFLNWRLKLTADYFYEYRNDILISRNTIPVSSGLNASNMPVVNMGEVRNQGFELELRWKQQLRNLDYQISANASYARNKILFMDEIRPNEDYMAQTGRPIGSIFGYVADGFYDKSDFEDGKLKKGLPDPGVSVYPGDVKYRDLNNDNVINYDDQTFLGYPVRPELTYGFNFMFKFYGVEISMNWTGVGNRSVLLANEYRRPFGDTGNHAIAQFMIDERWTPETADRAKAPRLSNQSARNNYDKVSSLWVRDASYFRLKSATISYSIPEGRFLKTLGLSNMNIYLAGYNLLTFDSLKYMDPESNASRTTSTYPITQTFTLGLNLNF